MKLSLICASIAILSCASGCTSTLQDKDAAKLGRSLAQHSTYNSGDVEVIDLYKGSAYNYYCFVSVYKGISFTHCTEDRKL